MENDTEERVTEQIKYFVASLKNTAWMLSANERTIDFAFICANDIQEKFLQDEKKKLYEKIVKKYPEVDLKKSVQLLMESFIRSSHLNNDLTLYAIDKYITFYSKTDFSRILKNMLSEVELRENLVKVIEGCDSNISSNWQKVNSLSFKLSNCKGNAEFEDIVLNALKTEASILLSNLKHSNIINGEVLIDKIIHILENQSDLKLWFQILKEENLETVSDLCIRYRNFLDAILKFFDKFANEVESYYDEGLSLKYSHVNLDFDDFVKVLKFFLKRKSINEVIDDYLQKRIELTHKNFVFWTDVKACI